MIKVQSTLTSCYDFIEMQKRNAHSNYHIYCCIA